MFTPRTNRTMLDAAVAQLQLIYHQTVHNLRSGHRNALASLLLTAVQSVVMIAGFMLLFLIMGMRTSPIRGDYLLYMMTGIFMFMTHVQAMAAVSTSGKSVGGMMKHEPLNTAVMISAAALAALYKQVFASVLILTVYYMFVPFTIEDPVACLGMLMLAWASGGAIGLVFLALRPWMPEVANVLTMVHQRANMVFSGKMFLANKMPTFMLPMFLWNPLFHIIDQTRGYAFINYTPLKTNLAYPIYFTLAVTLIGLMGEFMTRKSESISWHAGH